MFVLLIMHDMTVHYTKVRWRYQGPIPDTTIFVVSGVIKFIIISADGSINFQHFDRLQPHS